MYCGNLSVFLYCLHDSMANHSHLIYSYYFYEHPSGYVIIYKTYAWWMEKLLCNMCNLWLIYQYYCLSSVLKYFYPLLLLLMRPLITHDDQLSWLFKNYLIHISEQLCCLTVYCPDVDNLINELLEYT
jgi:hypothetical protein